MIFIGADGGGTKTAAAAYRDGVLVAEAAAGPMNYNFIGVERAAENLLEAIRALDIPKEEIAAIGIGDPSIDEGMPEGEPLRQFRERIRRETGIPVYVRSDAYMTLFGLGRRPAVLTISGTGAMSAAENAAGEILTAGGWGRLTGDEGSGYYIAVESIKAALRAADGLGETALLEAVLRYFGAAAPRELIDIFYGEHCPDVAGFAKLAAEAAEQGDKTAQRILLDTAGYLAACTIRLAQWSKAEIVGVYGSVLCKNRIVRQEFEQIVGAHCPGIPVIEPPVPATEAAARYAQMMFK